MASQFEPGAPTYATCVSRNLFLCVVAKHYPKVLARLRLDVLPLFSSLFEFRDFPDQGLNVGETSYGIEWLFSRQPPVERVAVITWGNERLWTKTLREAPPRWLDDFVDSADPKRATVRGAIQTWGRTCHLVEEWIYNAALDTLLRWIVRPKAAVDKWDCRIGYEIRPEHLPQPLEIKEQWLFEPWDKFYSKVQRQIATYKKTIEDLCASIGFDSETVRNSPHHYEWLAQFQVGCLSPGEIRRRHEAAYNQRLDESTITKGYTRLARRIGVTLRAKQQTAIRSSRTPSCCN
jgi:hypothetical protein